VELIYILQMHPLGHLVMIKICLSLKLFALFDDLAAVLKSARR
jgi:hypothetical protein